MSGKRKKKIVRIIHQSAGPLPLRRAAQFAEHLLVFTDASLKKHGGLAAVVFADAVAEPQVRTRTVAIDGSNELELQAALFGLEVAQGLFPAQIFALFSDNQDAVARLNRAQQAGLGQDPALAAMLAEGGIASTWMKASIHWIKGHGSCRGNTLADQHASAAALGMTLV